jgi:hypothetical protein
MAYGNNLKQIDSTPEKYGIYSGDVDQNGIIDASDESIIEYDAINLLSGYVVSDLTGDNFVDSGDLSISDNNSSNAVEKVTP